MTILEQLQDTSKLNSSEQRIAKFVLANKEQVLQMPIQELSQCTYASTSTIVRLCRKLGLKGYSDFKIRLSAELQVKIESASAVDFDFPFKEDDSYGEIAANLLELANESLRLTRRQLRSRDIEEAVRIIRGSHDVSVFAEGDSFVRALGFVNRVSKIGIHLLYALLPGEQDQLASTLHRGDAAVFVIYSGESKRLHRTAQVLNGNGVKIIAVTAYKDSHVGELAKVVISLADREDKNLHLSALSSQFSIEYALDVLYSCLFVADYEHNKRIVTEAQSRFIQDRYLE